MYLLGKCLIVYSNKLSVDPEVIEKIIGGIIGKICLNYTQGFNPERNSEVASEISATLKESTGIDFKVVVIYDENQPNRLVVDIR